MIDVKQFRESARKENLCAEYTKMWDSCKSKKQLMDMALGVKGVDYLCDAIAKGWGISPSYFHENFGNYMNGNYTSHVRGYTSKMYCEYEGDIIADTTIITLIDCNVYIHVPENTLCEVFCTGKCRINAVGDGMITLVCYGNPENTIVESESKYMKRINKKDRDRYEL